MQVGGTDGGALERFQALREEARKRIGAGEGRDGREALAELVRRKQAELTPGARRTAASALAQPVQPKAPEARRALPALPTQYLKAAEAQPEPASRRYLGNYVDLMA